MRYIGNKTRLLPFIIGTLRRLRIGPGVAHDAFAGTAAVGRALKEAGWRVASSDLMSYSRVLQEAYVVASGSPDFRQLADREPAVRRVLADNTGLTVRVAGPRPRNGRLTGNGAPVDALTAVGRYLAEELPPEPGFMTTHFSPAGGRMYFTEENAARIDAARRALHEWRCKGWIDDAGFYSLLAALIEGADRVANTAGVYAAYIKSWQANATRPLAIVPPAPTPGVPGSTAAIADAAEMAATLGAIDLLYIDPPYNARQYSGYYHVPELIARGWFDGPVILRGKTGLLPSDGQRSAWCAARKARPALRDLLAATGARHVLVSYYSEGLLPDAQLRSLLEAASVDGKVRRFTKRYRRYRADSDHAARRYAADSVTELLYYARLR